MWTTTHRLQLVEPVQQIEDEDRIHQEDMTWRTILLIVGMVACASTTRGNERKTDEPRGDMDTIGALNEICEVLTRNPLTPATAREALARSTVAWVRSARVIAAEGDVEPNHVELDLPVPLDRGALDHAFGVGREAPMLHPDSPTEVLYYPAVRAERRHTCAIIARVGADGVRAVAIRRDPRV
jgi:hypothetical protein